VQKYPLYNRMANLEASQEQCRLVFHI